MRQEEQLQIIEALLFSSLEPLTQRRVDAVFEGEAPRLKECIPLLQAWLQEGQHALEIQEVAGGYRLVTRAEYAKWIRRLEPHQGKLYLSKAALETLAIVAYKQPINRFDIEAIRGVDCTGVLKTLLTRNLIRISGRGTGPGRPLLYGTTRGFLEYFGVNSLADLPKLQEIKELDEGQSQEQVALFSSDVEVPISEDVPDLPQDFN
jgi:segregation and condensation protein B